MNAREIVRILAAGCVVYGAMAACSGSETPRSRPGPSRDSGAAESGPDARFASGGTGGQGSGKDASAGGFGGLLDAAVTYVRDAARDALGDRFVAPVPDAQAQADAAGAAGPTVVTVPCGTTQVIGGSSTFDFAEAEFPGKTKEQLALVEVVKTHKAAALGTSYYAPPGYYDSKYSNSVYVKPGWATVFCSPSTDISVTFILP